MILSMGGKYLGRYSPGQGTPPGTRYTPWGPGTSGDQLHPPGTRYTPQDQVHPLGPGTPSRQGTPQDHLHPPKDQVHPQYQVHPSGPGTPRWDQVPPRTSYNPPPDQVHPPGAEHDGRYGQQAGGTHPTGMNSCHQHYFSIP